MSDVCNTSFCLQQERSSKVKPSRSRLPPEGQNLHLAEELRWVAAAPVEVAGDVEVCHVYPFPLLVLRLSVLNTAHGVRLRSWTLTRARSVYSRLDL